VLFLEIQIPHDCKKNTKKAITLEMVLKKLESIGIIINVEANDGIMTQKEKEITHCSKCGECLEFERGVSGSVVTQVNDARKSIL
jgi:hypothetical protein